MHDSSAISKQRMIKTTNKNKTQGGGVGRGINVDTHTHSTDWLLHLQRGWRDSGSLYRLRSDNKSSRLSTHHPTTTNTSSCLFCMHETWHNWMALNNMDRSHLLRAQLSSRPPTCFCCHPILSDPRGVMEVGENLLFVLAALLWNEWDGVWCRHLFCR